MFQTLFNRRGRMKGSGVQAGEETSLRDGDGSAARDYLTMIAGREQTQEDEEGNIDQRYVEATEDGLESGEDGEDPPGKPLLPIFSASHLDALPTYDITHSIRLLISQRCETSLTWEQLRSPQVSQFLVKPIQQEIRTSHFSRATLYALMANCLQFSKESQVSPGNTGVLRTRAVVSELLAMRLLKELSLHERIDALSYDFDPLMGMAQPTDGPGLVRLISIKDSDTGYSPSTSRTSTLEVAIRAQAKKFLAHPLVVQHLEAIWAGTIVFHSAADSLHRMPSKPPLKITRQYGATFNPESTEEASPGRRKESTALGSAQTVRRAVTLYDPTNASLFKLSRLRVPRYRQTFSTISYAILVGLFVANLKQKSVFITPLEVVFWLWSAGFLLDEIMGVTEQGFGLYFLSFWNLFDIGILLIFTSYYILRLYGISLVREEKTDLANTAYDILAMSAILLFPRMFSFLDHFRYFSQLLIAFRMMVQDLIAVMVLIGVACSGFFVAFTLSFGTVQWTGGSVGYGLFQLLMGYTVAAWNVWGDYNPLGKVLLTIFLFLTHFLVVTMLISVLTNSFTSVVKNAYEEHQFLFAINVLSMVKSDALFSYVAPANILGWVFTPMRYMVPFRQYVRINRTIIKITHLPFLFLIFIYEKTTLSRYGHNPADLIEQRKPLLPFSFAGENLFSPDVRVREPSMATFKKDRALDEVFRRPYGGDSSYRKQTRKDDQRSNVVKKWMTGLGDEDDYEEGAPSEQARSLLEDLEPRRPRFKHGRFSSRQSLRRRNFSPSGLSMTSDPEEFGWRTTRRHRQHQDIAEEQDTAAGADNQNNDSTLNLEAEPPSARDFAREAGNNENDSPDTNLQPIEEAASSNSAASPGKGQARARHNRQTSTNTMIYSPLDERHEASATPERVSRLSRQGSLRYSPKRAGKARPRPIMPPRDSYLSAPNLAAFLGPNSRQPSARAQALDLASDIGNGPFHNLDPNLLSGSFETQMEWANRYRMQQNQDDSRALSRIVLSRMNTLEEGFKDILKELKDMKRARIAESSVAGRHQGYQQETGVAQGETSAEGGRRMRRDSQGARSLDDEHVSPTRASKGQGPSYSSV